MSGRRAQGAVVAVAAIVFALVFLVAVGANRSLASAGGPGPVRWSLDRVVGGGGVGADLLVIVLAVGLVGLAALAYSMWTGVRDGSLPPPRRQHSWWKELTTYLTMIALAAVVFLFAARMSPRTLGGRGGAGAGRLPPSVRENPNHRSVATPHWWFLGGLALLVLAIAAVVLVRRRTRRISPPSLAAADDALREAVEVSLEELESEPDPRRAVVRAYVGMESTLARRGAARESAETPLEYLTRLLAAGRVSRAAGEPLTRLFERARFSEHTLGPEQKRQAIAALVAVREELAEARP
jgi:hypothetical protein